MRPTRKAYEKGLNQLANRLKRGPMTAKAIGELFGCSKQVAKKRVRDLEQLGFRVFVEVKREGLAGPKSKAFGVR